MDAKEEKLKQLGERIRELRKEKKVSLSEVGKTVNLSHNFLSEVERGKKEPSYNTLRTLSCYFGIDEDELFEIIDKVPLRAMELVEEHPELQKLLSQVKKKYGNDSNKISSVSEKIIKMYQEFLDEEE
ncbi:helix-turn-helix domain-containing protein [Bacillus sp. FSL R10-2789]|uniref:helix-turn-helix domain-containing protein n=1 Tax=Bacillus sp. FSL R10-2789 TaxID=2954662 RepID=UPI0030FA66E8